MMCGRKPIISSSIVGLSAHYRAEALIQLASIRLWAAR